MNTPTLCSLACLATGILALALPLPAGAARAHDSSAGGSCHSANPTSKFTRNNHYTTNIGTTDQYLICQFQMDDDEAVAATDITHLQMFPSAGASGGTVTCIAQIGAYYDGSLHVEASQAQSLTLAAGASGYLDWNVPLVRSVYYNVLTMNCKVPAGFKFGLVEWSEG